MSLVSHQSRGTARRVGTWLPILVVAALVLIAQTSLGSWLLSSMGVAADTPPFLELSFADPLAHPPSVTPGTIVPVSFVLGSHGRDYDNVTWHIDTIDASGTTRAASGSTAVPDGETRTVDTDVTVPCRAAAAGQSRTQIRVSVSDPAESILFWVACDAAAN